MDPRVDRAVRALDRIDRSTGAHHDSAERWSGSDRSGAVTVVIAPDGRIHSMSLDPRWRDVLRPDELGTAIIAARTHATERRLDAWSEAMVRPVIRPNQHGRLAHDQVPPDQLGAEPGRADAEDAELTPKDLSELLAGVADEVSRYRQAHRDLRIATRNVTSPDRCVTVTVSAERVVGVEFYRDWIKFASATDIETSTMAAITAAYGECDRIPEDLDRQFPAIAAYRAYRRRVP